VTQEQGVLEQGGLLSRSQQTCLCDSATKHSLGETWEGGLLNSLSEHKTELAAPTQWIQCSGAALVPFYKAMQSQLNAVYFRAGGPPLTHATRLATWSCVLYCTQVRRDSHGTSPAVHLLTLRSCWELEVLGTLQPPRPTGGGWCWLVQGVVHEGKEADAKVHKYTGQVVTAVS
jgi:hypothetical protein